MRFVLVVAATLAMACAPRKTLTESHGRSTEAVFAQQRANPAPAPGPSPKAVQGLESQEATIIAEGYFRSLAPEGEQVEQPPVLLVGPSRRQYPQQQQPPPLPRPSVPKE